uniref:Uncharacterized protein n=1 Tax=Solanum lycopersicum TaxID=4081 RepID=A0A494G9R2_SOLLC
MLIGVAERQEGQEHLLVADPEVVDEHFRGPRRIVEDRAMMLHHATRRATGATGVDKAGGIVARHRLPTRLEVGAIRLAARNKRLPVEHLHIALLADAHVLHRDHGLDIRTQHRGHQHAREFRGRDDNRTRAAVVEDMLVIALGIRGVGGNRDAARRHDRKVGDAEFGAVLADQNDAVAVLQSQLAQIVRERRDLVRDLPPAQRVPRPVGLAPQKRIFAAAPRTVEEHRDQTREMVEMRVYELHAFVSPGSVIGVLVVVGRVLALRRRAIHCRCSGSARIGR